MLMAHTLQGVGLFRTEGVLKKIFDIWTIILGHSNCTRSIYFLTYDHCIIVTSQTLQIKCYIWKAHIVFHCMRDLKKNTLCFYIIVLVKNSLFQRHWLYTLMYAWLVPQFLYLQQQTLRDRIVLKWHIPPIMVWKCLSIFSYHSIMMHVGCLNQWADCL